MKLSIIPFLLILVFILSAFDAQAILTTANSTVSTSSTLSKSNVTSILGRKLKAKEKLGLWILRRKIKKAQRKNPNLFRNLQTPTDTSKCSTILFKSGMELQAKIIEISETDIEFIRCGQSDTISMSKRDIESITLHDGIKIFKNNGRHHSRKPRRKKKPSDNLGIVAILSAIIAIPLFSLSVPLGTIFAIMALLFGVSGMSADYTRNKGIAVWGLISGIFALLINWMRKINQA